MWRICLITYFMVFLNGYISPGIVTSEDHPNFSGTYVLDLNAPESSPMAPLLKKIQDASWIERKLIDSVPVTQTYTQRQDQIVINIENPITGRTKEVLLLDGIPRYRETDRLGTVEICSSWLNEGKAIETILKFNTPEHKKATWIIRRYLVEKGHKIIVDHLLKVENNRTITAKRIFRKK